MRINIQVEINVHVLDPPSRVCSTSQLEIFLEVIVRTYNIYKYRHQKEKVKYYVTSEAAGV
jgi:hypothetical protein